MCSNSFLLAIFFFVLQLLALPNMLYFFPYQPTELHPKAMAGVAAGGGSHLKPGPGEAPCDGFFFAYHFSP